MVAAPAELKTSAEGGSENPNSGVAISGIFKLSPAKVAALKSPATMAVQNLEAEETSPAIAAMIKLYLSLHTQNNNQDESHQSIDDLEFVLGGCLQLIGAMTAVLTTFSPTHYCGCTTKKLLTRMSKFLRGPLIFQ